MTDLGRNPTPSTRILPQPRRTADLVRSGYSTAEIARMARAGELDRIRRGFFAFGPGAGGPDRDRARHRQLIDATADVVAGDAVVSHRSAAILWGLRVDHVPGRVDLTRPPARHGRDRGCVHLRVARLDPTDVATLDGVLVTSLARTVVDLACSYPLVRSVVTGDSALASGLQLDELEDCLSRARGRRGVIAARRACAFFDARSESGGESVSRVRLSQAGVPTPTLQYEVIDGDGVLIGRSDFYWEQFRTLGEFDGRIKYGRLLKPGQASHEVVWAEKRREDAMRDTGRQMVRWTWEDLRGLRELVGRLERAFVRGR